MRHCNPTSTSCCSWKRGNKVTEPYYSQYIDSYENTGFAKANSKKRYVQVLQYIADHDGCKLHEVKCGVWHLNPDYSHRGFMSGMFSQLLYIDVIDYDKAYKYHITNKGREVLKKAYLNEMESIVKGK